jgi:formiminotetrahydrofolate cyclodeaminase
MLTNTCLEFIDQLASKEPVPGGGGASAFVGSLGIALGSMVGNLTVGKKKYADVEEDMSRLLKDSRKLTHRFNSLVLRDAEVFKPLADAYGMPTGTEEEKALKEKVLQAALIDAATVPLEIAESSVEALYLLEEYAWKGSRLVVSDAGVGATFCKAALLGAKLNVLINLKLMKNEALKIALNERLETALNVGIPLADKIYNYVEGELI